MLWAQKIVKRADWTAVWREFAWETDSGIRLRLFQLFDQTILRAIWNEQGVHTQSDGIKGLLHPVLGAIELEYLAFAVSDRPDLRMIIWNPVQAADAERIKALLIGRKSAANKSLHDNPRVLEPSIEE